jgi:NAD-dependent SIR2 family protein deacetylase
MPTTAQNPLNHSLLHVHVCVHCANSFRREEVEGRVHTTGLFICPKCGKEGPLNVEILEVGDKDSEIFKG